MKSLKSYLTIAVFCLSLAFVPSAFSNAIRPIKGIDVVVLKKPGTASRQTATPNKDGSYSVNLPGPGNYTISYADGPKKGQTIKQVTATKAGPVSVSASASASQ